MPRIPRKAPGGMVYHVLNRANGRLRLFKKEEDYLAFEQVLLLAHDREPMRVLGWCLMPNHWHLVLWPRRDGELSNFMRWLTLTQAQRWKHAHDAVGHGHLYQGRFRSFAIQSDRHLLTVLRYVERNALRAGLAREAQAWPGSSAYVRQTRGHELQSLLCPWPVPRPRDWLEILNEPQDKKEEEQLKRHIERSRPLGDEPWTRQTASRLGLAQTLRPRGRPPGWRKNKGK